MSEILFLGTGAADWRLEQKEGFFRRNSAAMINKDLLLDCGPHIFDFAADFYGEHLYDGVTDILITHNHGDHFRVESVHQLADKQKIRIGCDAFVKEKIGEHKNITFTVFTPYKMERMGAYEVLPMLANHDVVYDGEKRAYHYLIKTQEGKIIFYGLDGAWFLRPTWNEMLKYKYDMIVLDCTVGDQDDWRLFEHNTIPMIRTMTKEILQKNLLTENGVVVASHFARTLHKSHEETAQILKEINVLSAYDGLKLILGEKISRNLT